MQPGRDQLRAWMKRAKFNQRQAAEFLGFHEVFISQLLSGIRSPGRDNAVKIEELTTVPVESWSQSKVSTRTAEPVFAGAKRKLTKR